MSKFTTKRDRLLRYLQSVERLSPSDFAMCRSIAVKELGLTRRQLEPIFHAFKSRNPLSDQDAQLFIAAVESEFGMAGGDA